MREPRPRPGRWSSIYSRPLAKVLTLEEMTLVEWIFKDAYLVDVDLSSWTEFIALYLVATYAEERSARGSGSLFIVEFLRAAVLDEALIVGAIVVCDHLRRRRRGRAPRRCAASQKGSCPDAPRGA